MCLWLITSVAPYVYVNLNIMQWFMLWWKLWLISDMHDLAHDEMNDIINNTQLINVSLKPFSKIRLNFQASNKRKLKEKKILKYDHTQHVSAVG